MAKIRLIYPDKSQFTWCTFMSAIKAIKGNLEFEYYWSPKSKVL